MVNTTSEVEVVGGDRKERRRGERLARYYKGKGKAPRHPTAACDAFGEAAMCPCERRQPNIQWQPSTMRQAGSPACTIVA